MPRKPRSRTASMANHAATPALPRTKCATSEAASEWPNPTPHPSELYLLPSQHCQADLVQMTRSDQLGWHAELAEVDNERAEDRGEAVQGSPLRPRSHHPVRSLVSPVQGQSA